MPYRGRDKAAHIKCIQMRKVLSILVCERCGAHVLCSIFAHIGILSWRNGSLSNVLNINTSYMPNQLIQLTNFYRVEAMDS